MALQMVKVQIRRNLEIDGKKADGSDKSKEGDEQLPVTGDSGNNLEAMGVVVMGLMSGLAAMNRRKKQD